MFVHIYIYVPNKSLCLICDVHHVTLSPSIFIDDGINFQENHFLLNFPPIFSSFSSLSSSFFFCFSLYFSFLSSSYSFSLSFSSSFPFLLLFFFFFLFLFLHVTHRQWQVQIQHCK